MNIRLVTFFVLGVLGILRAGAQDSVSVSPVISSAYVSKVSSKTAMIENKLDKQTEKTLCRMKKEELKLNRKLARIDSAAAARLFSGTEQKYRELQEKFSSAAGRLGPKRLDGVPYLDTLKNALQFLDTDKGILSGKTGEKSEKIKGALASVNRLDAKISATSDIQQSLKERRQYLKEQLSKFGLAKQMKTMNKKLYYYSQSFKEYKDMLKDTKKMEAQALTLLRKTPAFRKLMEKNSLLSSVFGVSSGNAGSSPVALTGLQTRASVQQLLQNASVGGSSPQQFVSQQLQSATQAMSQQKNSIRLPELQENTGEMPDFKPNQQKTKPFLKRLEYGANIQFGKINQLLPATSELAASLGYKLNDNGVIGIGASYRLGIGNIAKHLNITGQGFGLRSYIDWKIKHGIFISGGYEKNYLPELAGLTALSKSEVWQESGLIGIGKKYPLSKDRKGFAQLLFDFLSYRNLPRSQPILFRTGIKF